MEKNKIIEIIDFYYSLKKEGDYLLFSEKEIEIDVFNVQENKFIKNKTKQVPTSFDLINYNKKIISNLEIEQLSPDLIDNKFFWKYITDKFPLFSISKFPNCKNEDEVNKANFNASIWLGFYQKIEKVLNKNKNARILEIGPGYGSLFYPINKKFNFCDYWAIDINPLFYFEGLIETNGTNIPNNVGGNFDLIFSFNVFNHLSKKQRSEYYNNIYNSLKKNGKFIFTNFLSVNIEEENGYWQFVDENNNFYTSFFSQLTEVDNYNNLADELNEIGFSINVKMSQNTAVIECEKI